MPTRSGVAAAIVPTVLALACSRRDLPIDPESRAPRVHATDADARRQVHLREVVAARFGVPDAAAGPTLERQLQGRADALLARWPRTANGSLDVDRAPLEVTELSAWIGPGSKSRCGEVTVVFQGATGPALRVRLPVPATIPPCRGILRDNQLTGPDALAALRAAIADARVSTAPAIAAD